MTDTFPPPGYVPVDSQVDGIDVFMPAPPGDEEHQAVVDFKCPQCGATTAYSIADAGLTCTHCGYYEAPDQEAVGRGAQEFEFTVETVERSAQGWGKDRKEIDCQNCGARTTIPEDMLTLTCPFCASNNVIQRKAPQDILRPRFLIPFKVKLEDCRPIVVQWLGSNWMTPRKLLQVSRLGDFAPVYLPFWTFDTITVADWRAEVGHTVSERYYDHGDKTWKTRTRTVWRKESGRVSQKFDDLLVEGSSKVSGLLLGRIKGFNLNDLVPYDAEYLAGMNAQAYDVRLERAWETGRKTMRDITRTACRNQASTSQIRNFKMSLDFREEEWRYILLPVYIAAYRYQEQIYQILVNGQTGEISGQRPADWTKIWLVVAALLAPGLILGLIGLITLVIGGVGIAVGVVGFVLLIIGLVISLTIVRQAQQLDDA